MTSHKQSQDDHGTISSYVVGFVLSLIFTFIPYFMVVNQTVSGTALLISILGFALIQLIIQITFFLHIGRGPKPNWNLYFFGSTMVIVLMVVGGSVFIINNLIYNMKPSDQSIKLIEGEGIYQIDGVKTGACYGQHETHKIIIKDRTVVPLFTFSHECDTLIFVNEDDEVREMAFGEHPARDVYAGEDELIVRKGRSKSIVLSQIGEYKFHDHLDPSVMGYFTVVAE